jgi:type VI protein secretion system component VasK
MERVMETVSRNTNLSAKPESGGVWAWIKGLFSSATTNETGGSTPVETEFRPLFQFVSSGENKKEGSPMSEYRAELRRLLDPIEAAPQDRVAEIQKAVASGKDEIGLQKADQAIGRLLDGFKTAAGTDAAALLKQPLTSLRRFFFGGAYQQIAKEWTEQVYKRAHGLEMGYPFGPGGDSSVTDLALFLNPVNGQFTSFYARIASSFEGSPGEWRPKESAPFRFADDFVKYLNNAGRLREALFSGGQQPELSYTLELQPVENADTTITIDGTRVEAQGTLAASTKFTWPAKPGSSSASIIVRSGTDTLGEKSFNGDWGLFKMFEAGSPTQSPEGGYLLRWNLNSVTVRAKLTPGSSSKNPFDRRVFTSLRAPQSIEK